MANDDLLDRLQLVLDDCNRIAPMSKYRKTLEDCYNEIVLYRKQCENSALNQRAGFGDPRYMNGA